MIGPNGIFSAQNGLLLRTLIHTMFGEFMLSINPDVSYYTHSAARKKPLNQSTTQHGHRVVCFVEDVERCGGGTLSSSTRPAENSNATVSDEASPVAFPPACLDQHEGCRGEAMGFRSRWGRRHEHDPGPSRCTGNYEHRPGKLAWALC